MLSGLTVNYSTDSPLDGVFVNLCLQEIPHLSNMIDDDMMIFFEAVKC